MFTLCIALTKQLLGSLVGEGAEFSPFVDGDAVDDVEDEDWELPLCGWILPPLCGIKFPLFIIRELFGTPFVPPFNLTFAAPFVFAPFPGEVDGIASIWSIPLDLLPPLFGTMFSQQILPNPDEGWVKSWSLVSNLSDFVHCKSFKIKFF